MISDMELNHAPLSGNLSMEAPLHKFDIHISAKSQSDEKFVFFLLQGHNNNKI